MSLEVLADPRLDENRKLQPEPLDVFQTQENLLDFGVGETVASSGCIENCAGVRLQAQLDLPHLGRFVEQGVLVRQPYQQLVLLRERNGLLKET